ncbi:MAG: hypothetical protein JNL11_00155 [Bdellovibrionaceae bacterium]|nr:hypothetical protein [Pseudobdellovibrionaceae bacterium]
MEVKGIIDTRETGCDPEKGGIKLKSQSVNVNTRYLAYFNSGLRSYVIGIQIGIKLGMKFFLFSLTILGTLVTYGFESKITLSINDMNRNSSVAGSSKGDILTVAARVFQLQLEASKCEGVSVNQAELVAYEENNFLVTSKNCTVKNKKTEECEVGFAARNINENPRTPGDAIVGGDVYKICVKEHGKKSGGPLSPEQKAPK